MAEPQEIDWTAVIARTLGFLCIHQAKLQDETLVKQADFLERFGIPRSEAAVILGSSEKSLYEMDRRSRAKTMTRRGPAKKKG